jgi:hypothetical protein
MRNQLYVSNLSEATTDEIIREIFAEFGEIESIEMGVDETTEDRFALVTMVVEKQATKALNTLNGREVEGNVLLVSYPHVDLNRPLLPKQAKAAAAIAETLDETEEVPVRQINMLVRLCGNRFAETLADEAKRIEAGDGMMTLDGSRKRTVGGTFFQLMRVHTAPDVRRIVWSRKGKPPVEVVEETTQEV